MPQINKRIGFIGAGNMAKGIVTSMLDAGLIAPEKLIVSAPTERNMNFWKNKGIPTTKVNADVVDRSDVVILAVKPQNLDDVIKSLTPFPTDMLFISILVGITIEKLNDKICSRFNSSPPDSLHAVRIMPNPPIAVGAGASAYCVNRAVTHDDLELVKSIFSSGGICHVVPEKLMNVATALSGSGTGYMYLVIEALCDGAVKMGLPRVLATEMACQTVMGAAKMIRDTGRHPGQLKDEACSPGGCTIAGLHTLERAAVRSALISAVEEATNRSFELGGNS